MARPMKLDDAVLRDRILDLIRAGHGQYDAATTVGVSLQAYRAYKKRSAEFREEIEDAINASVEPVLKKARDLALKGDTTAMNTYLKHQAPPARSEVHKVQVDHTHKHELDAATISSIAELQARVSGRPAIPSSPIDQVIDIKETDHDEEDATD